MMNKMEASIEFTKDLPSLERLKVIPEKIQANLLSSTPQNNDEGNILIDFKLAYSTNFKSIMQ